jgi:hypothetical protein
LGRMNGGEKTAKPLACNMIAGLTCRPITVPRGSKSAQISVVVGPEGMLHRGGRRDWQPCQREKRGGYEISAGISPSSTPAEASQP